MKFLDINYFQNKINDISIEVNGYLIHSKYDPIKEVRNLLENKFKYDHLTIFFGNGRGYLTEALKSLQVIKDNVLIIEPIQQFNMFKDPNYDIIYGFNIEEILELMEKKNKFFSEKIDVICMPNYSKIFYDEFVELSRKVDLMKSKTRIYTDTINLMSNTWQENDIRNVYYINKAYSLQLLEKVYCEPVVIASAGPSLNKQLPLLNKIREKVILIAAGSAIDTLVENKMEPDFVVTVDGSESNYTSHFKDLSLNNTKLIFSNTSHYKIQGNFKNSQYAFVGERDKKYSELLNTQYDIDLPVIKGEGSVATYALSIARFISNGPIALIGQDLAYTNMQSHAIGNKYFELIKNENLNNPNLFEVNGYLGKNVLTDSKLYLMKEKFEELICDIELKDTIYNCTEGGVTINGFNHISFNDFCINYVHDHLRGFKLEVIEQEFNIMKVIHTLKRDIENYLKLKNELEHAIEVLRFNKLENDFTPSTIELLDKVDKNIGDLILSTPMERIKDPITLDIMNNYKAQKVESSSERFTRVFNQNLNYYLKMIEALNLVIKYTGELIEELTGRYGVSNINLHEEKKC